jgi:hypothetical protein
MTIREQNIKHEAEIIKEKLSHSLLMGEPVDVSNIDELIWCAYMMGRQEAEHKAYKDMQFQRELYEKALGNN